MDKNENPITKNFNSSEYYSRDRFVIELEEWKRNLKKIVKTTGLTNFNLLRKNYFFKRLFPSVTISDEVVINKLLADMKKLRK